jgi:hypothetical protein
MYKTDDGSLEVAVIRYTDCADLTDTRGFSIKKSVFVRVIHKIRVQKVVSTAIPNEPRC